MAASNPVVSNALLLEVLNRNNYRHWRSRMKTYLLSEDLWEVVEAISREPVAAKLEDDDEAEYNKSWTKKNAKALYAIQNSCGREMFSFISETETAKGAWEALERVSKLAEKSAHDFEPYIPFTDSVKRDDWNRANECLGKVDVHGAVRAVDPRDGFGNIALHVAARNGNVNIVRELVTLMTLEDRKMKNAHGLTALHEAARKGKVHTVKELVPFLGEEKDNNGDTALHIAVHHGKVDIVKVLVQFMRPEDLKVKNKNGYTALHLAVYKGNVHTVKELGRLMGKVRNGDGDTALHIAVKKGNVEIVKQLVLSMRPEDLAIKNSKAYTAFHLAIKEGNVPIVKEFVTKYEGHDEKNIIAKEDLDRYIPFTTHVRNGDLDKVKECLTQLHDPYDAITRVDPRDQNGDTALHVAVKERHARIMEELVLFLKERQEKDLKLKTAQDFIAFGSGINFLGVSKQVVMEGAKYMVEQYEKMLSKILDVQDAKGSTVLHLAVLQKNEDIVKQLVPLMRQEGFEVINNDGKTALHEAVLKGNVNVVEELVQRMREKGLEIKTADGFNALHLAVKHGHMNIVKKLISSMRKEALEDKNCEDNTALGCALAVRKDEDVMEMAKYMAEKNNQVFCIHTLPINLIPVVWACKMSKWELARYLYHLTPLKFLMPEHGMHGAHLISLCLRAKKFGT